MVKKGGGDKTQKLGGGGGGGGRDRDSIVCITPMLQAGRSGS